MMTARVCLLHVSGGLAYSPGFRAAFEDVDAELDFYAMSGLSSKYDEFTGIAKHHTLTSWLRARHPGWKPGEPIVLVSWSAGTWAIRHWLRRKEARDMVSAVVILDGLHAGSNEKDPADLLYEGVFQYARECMANPAHKLLVVTNSDIRPPYASTTAVAAEMLDRLGILQPPARRKRDDGEVPGVAVLDYGGGDGKAHTDHVFTYGPAILRTRVVPLLRRLLVEPPEHDTEPNIPAMRPELPLRERALAVALAEAKRWGSSKPSSARVAEYFGECARGGVVICGWLADQVRGGVAHAHCAAATGWTEHQAAAPGDELPPWRAAAREIERDAKAGKRGRWVPQGDAIAGYVPPPGALAVYWRGSESSGQGHVERVIRATREGYWSVGANEAAGAWYVDVEPQPYTHARLLGFVVDDEAPLRVGDPPGSEPASDFVERPMSLGEWEQLRPRLVPLEVDWDEHRRDRDRAIREE